jgi:hypothetical protein
MYLYVGYTRHFLFGGAKIDKNILPPKKNELFFRVFLLLH